MSKSEGTSELFSEPTVFNVDSLRSKSSFRHIPMDDAITRIDNGTLLMSEVTKIFQVQCDLWTPCTTLIFALLTS